MAIPRTIAAKIKGTTWYHQRFDAAPLYLMAVGEAETKRETRKLRGTEADIRVCFFDKSGKADWYLDMRDVERGAHVIVNRAKKDPRLSSKLMRAWRKDEDIFEKFFERSREWDLRSLSDNELAGLSDELHRLWLQRFTSSSIIDHFALGTDELVANRLRRELRGTKFAQDFTEVFSTLTAPVHQSFVGDAELSLLRIAIHHPRSKAKLAAHQQNFFWIRNNYRTAYVLSVSYFAREITRWKKSGVDLKVKYRELSTAPQRNAQKKAALLRRIKLSAQLRTLLKISEDLTHWQDQRKRSTFLNIHMGERILKEIARRRKVDANVLKELLPGEIGSFLLANTPTIGALRRRQRGCGVVATREGYTVFTGREIKELKRLMLPKRQQNKVEEVRGLAASLGKVRGPAKIIHSVKEIRKVRPGDVLVAVMTRPDYMVGIKHAAAIVTNEGGVTCHAAIVSRELGIPCVIGTKIATEVFKDGDLIEVNANDGVVTRIKK